MKNILILLLVIVIFTPSAWGQSVTVTGTVVSNTETPVSKIRLTIEGLPYGDVTKKNGSFKLEKVLPEDTIVVPLKNKMYAKFLLGDCKTLKIVLSDNMVEVHRDGVAMEKVKAQKKTYGFGDHNSTRIVTAKMIERIKPRTVADAIKMTNPNFNARPISINSDKIPLVYLDGTETTFDNINSLPIQYVETIEVNKHGEGYGARGAAGVILVTSKK